MQSENHLNQLNVSKDIYRTYHKIFFQNRLSSFLGDIHAFRACVWQDSLVLRTKTRMFSLIVPATRPRRTLPAYKIHLCTCRCNSDSFICSTYIFLRVHAKVLVSAEGLTTGYCDLSGTSMY